MNTAFAIKKLMMMAVTFLAILGNAQAAEALKMQLQANKVTINDAGNTIYLPVNTAPVGTVIQYKATYTNTLDKDVSDLTVVVPIPVNMTFTGKVIPASAQASIDNENYADLPLMRFVDGKMVKIPLSEYRTLRWNIKLLPAHKSASVAFNTTLD